MLQHLPKVLRINSQFRILEEENLTRKAESKVLLSSMMFQERRLCVKLFSAITCFSEKTIWQHAAQVSSSSNIQSYDNLRRTSRKGKPSNQSQILVAFLKHYSSKYGLPDPRGRINTSDQVRKIGIFLQ